MPGEIFGGLFDFNMDGKTDGFEFAMGLHMIHEIEKKDREAKSSTFDPCRDLDDPDDSDGFDPFDI